MYVPENKRLGYSPDKVLDFPDGSVLIKTFAYLNDHPESKIDKQLLETRLLIKKMTQLGKMLVMYGMRNKMMHI